MNEYTTSEQDEVGNEPKAASRPADRAQSPLDSIWRQEAVLVTGILEDVRAILRNIGNANHAADGRLEAVEWAGDERPDGELPKVSAPVDPDLKDKQPLVLAKLTSVDPNSGDCYLYEVVDVDGRPICHPYFELIGSDLCLRPDAAIPESDTGCASLHLAITNAAGDQRIEEYVVRFGNRQAAEA